MGIWWVLRIRSVPWFWLVLVSFRGFFAFRLFVGITFLVLFDGFPWFCCFTVFVGCSTRSKIDIAFLETHSGLTAVLNYETTMYTIVTLESDKYFTVFFVVFLSHGIVHVHYLCMFRRFSAC